MNVALDLPGTRLFLALWGGMAVVVLTRPLPDQVLALAALVVVAAHHQTMPVAVAAAAVVALVDNGFVVNSGGTLAWGSTTDVARSVALVVVGAVTAAVHA